MPSPSNAANGLSKRSKRKGSDESHGSQGSLQFGKLTRRLNSEIQALSPAHTALSNISTLFREYRSEVEVFESNFDTMKAKDDQIRDLNTAMRIWKSTSNEEVEKLRSELESMEEGRKRLREEKQQFATTRDSKMQELEQNEKKLVDMEYRLKDGYEQQLKKAKDALKAETRETITQLQAANEKMTREVANLKIELAGAHDTIANERQDWYILRSELKKEKQALCEELESLKSDFAMEARPDDF
ncbi:hypothetical protein MMC21_001561 [Puttea exsequens]|nr:hypothetical protein [Puttea exsequens]